MDEDVLSKFIRVMSMNITDSDLELINLGKSLGLDLVSFVELRGSQEEEFTDKIREKALDKMEINKDHYLSETDMFYAGSIDFMVCDEPEGKRFFLLETNGGSNRGLSILTLKQQAIKYDGFFEAIDQAIKKNKRGDNKVLVLVGVPINDGLIHEKVIVVEYLRQRVKAKKLSVGIYNIHNFPPEFEEDVVFLIADYKQLSTTLSFVDNWVMFNDKSKVSVLLGDGIARRIHDDEFSRLVKEDFRKINSIIINPIFRISDDKSLTYLASYFSKEILEKYKLKYLLFSKAYSEEELIDKIKDALLTYKKPFIIKPNGGSGGAGVIPIGPNQDLNNLKDLIDESKKEFFSKFMKNRDPYPYTIQEMAEFSLIEPPFSEGKHTFDLRIYLAQKEGKIIPIGGLARVARGEYHGTLDKQEFVVNLSGFDGQIEVFRGQGISEKNAKMLDLTLDDFVNIYCISSVVFVSIIENYQRIMNFSEWDQIIG